MFELKANLSADELIIVGLALGGTLPANVETPIDSATQEEVHAVTSAIPAADLGKSPAGGAAATAATETTQAPDTVGAAANVDKDGVVWDSRIHSSNQKMTAKGVWQKKRGVDDSLVASVMAELKGETTAAAEAPATDIAQQGFGAQPPGGMFDQQPAAEAPAAAVDFQTLLQSHTMRSNDATNPEKAANYAAQSMQILQSHQLTAIPQLLGQPHLVPQIHSELENLWNTLS